MKKEPVSVPVAEQIGYDMQTMSTTLQMWVQTKDCIIDISERITVKERSNRPEHHGLFATVAYTALTELHHKMLLADINPKDCIVPEISDERLNRVVEHDFPFNTPLVEFITNYVRFDGIDKE